MKTTMTIPTLQSAFQCKLLEPSSFKNAGAMSFTSIPRQKFIYGMVRASIQNPHTVLGVAPGASKSDIKKAYKRLVLEYHHDVCKGSHCTTDFQEINLAYKTLLYTSTPQPTEFKDDSFGNIEGFMEVDDDYWDEWWNWMGGR
ncbi:hypothetical protein KC19_3G155500 [Ceratodon purpureus]|uniref:J domain-containing protein n=1 Tax=Ceratodon purpureus TaxID=3225 RepID=A0A8T0IKA3_CERPU|nr:hypothetical protein KC19_3G155500 [Ceratodon purpureus]